MSPEATQLPRGASRRRLAIVWIAAVLAVALAAAVGVAMAATGDAAFANRYHELQRRYKTLESSGHHGISCVACHGAKGGVAGVVARVDDYYRGMITTLTAPTFTTYEPPSDAACLTCHDYDWSDDASRTARVPHPAHPRTGGETRGCVSCHKWTAHEESYQAKHTSMPFSVVCASFGCHVGTKQKAECINCHHILQEAKGDWRTTHPAAVRASGPNACVETCHSSAQCEECHTTGKVSSLPSSIATASATAIELLHVKADWISQHGTVALEAPAKCTTCHISEGECQDCHATRPVFHDPASTWLVRHKDLSKDTRRCLTCHEQPWCDACHVQFKEMS